MNKTLTLIACALLPAIAMAGGNHAGGHAMQDTHNQMHGNAAAPSVGIPGDPARVTRDIEVSMDDSMRFSPDHITVKAGETIRFVARNNGKLAHEMVIGAMSDLTTHAAMMRKFPGMEHEEPNMVTLQPGQRGELVWHFDQPGTVDFACLIPGHMEAGMIAKVSVIQ